MGSGQGLVGRRVSFPPRADVSMRRPPASVSSSLCRFAPEPSPFPGLPPWGRIPDCETRAVKHSGSTPAQTGAGALGTTDQNGGGGGLDRERQSSASFQPLSTQ